VISDFLTRLVERTLGLAEVVQPLVTPVYAKEAIAKGDILSPLDNQIVVNETPPLDAELSHKPHQPDQDSLPEKPVHGGIAYINKSEDYPIKELEDGPSTPEKSEGDAIAPPREFTTLHAKGKREISQRIHLNIFPTEKPDKPPALLYDSEDLLIPEETHTIGKRQTVNKAMNFKSGSPLKKALVPEVSNNIELIKTDSMNRQFTDMAAASENTHIKINIGRIEVKAITPPVPTRAKPSRPSPRITLEDYLKQRNEGKR
jgi:hypothetical protein